MAVASTNYSSTTDTTAITLTLASLATSAGALAGRESTVVTNVSNKYLDVIVTGQITTGTTPTVNTYISVYAYAPLKLVTSTASYPIATATALTGVDAAATFEAGQRDQLRLGSAMKVNATSNRSYSFTFSLAQLFGGNMPLLWGLWVTNESGVALNATAGNHWAHYVGIKTDIV